MAIDLDKTYTNNELCAHTSLGDKSIILNIENGQYYELNSTSTLIWNLLGEQKTISEIIDIISKKYNCQDEDIAKSVTKFLNSCFELNFIKEAE